MKTVLASIQSKPFTHEIERDVQERGKMILEYFDELSVELIMK